MSSCHSVIELSLFDLQTASNLCFIVNVAANVEVAWETIYVDRKLYVEIPNSLLPEGSKERYLKPIAHFL